MANLGYQKTGARDEAGKRQIMKDRKSRHINS